MIIGVLSFVGMRGRLSSIGFGFEFEWFLSEHVGLRNLEGNSIGNVK
jgi:hypothetical protein